MGRRRRRMMSGESGEEAIDCLFVVDDIVGQKRVGVFLGSRLEGVWSRWRKLDEMSIQDLYSLVKLCHRRRC